MVEQVVRQQRQVLRHLLLQRLHDVGKAGHVHAEQSAHAVAADEGDQQPEGLLRRGKTAVRERERARRSRVRGSHLLLHVREKEAGDEAHALAVADARVIGGIGAEDVEERALGGTGCVCVRAVTEHGSTPRTWPAPPRSENSWCLGKVRQMSRDMVGSCSVGGPRSSSAYRPGRAAIISAAPVRVSHTVPRSGGGIPRRMASRRARGSRCWVLGAAKVGRGESGSARRWWGALRDVRDSRDPVRQQDAPRVDGGLLLRPVDGLVGRGRSLGGLVPAPARGLPDQAETGTTGTSRHNNTGMRVMQRPHPAWARKCSRVVDVVAWASGALSARRPGERSAEAGIRSAAMTQLAVTGSGPVQAASPFPEPSAHCHATDAVQGGVRRPPAACCPVSALRRRRRAAGGGGGAGGPRAARHPLLPPRAHGACSGDRDGSGA